MNKYFIEPLKNDGQTHTEKEYVYSKQNALVALVENVDWNKLCATDKVGVYSVVGGHGEVEKGYLSLCREISQFEYVELTQGAYVPLEYVL